MRQGFVEPDARREFLGKSPGGAREKLLVARFAGAQKNHLEIPLHQFVKNLFDEIDTLLRSKPADHTQQRVGFPRQAQASLQTLFADALAREIVFAIWLGDEGIGLRAPLVVIHAVQDPDHIPGALSKHPFQAKALLHIHDLLGVTGAHGGNLIGKDQGAF